MNQEEQEGVTLFDIFNHFVSAIFNNNNNNNTLTEKIKGSFYDNVPLVHQASNNTAHNVYNWTRKGSPLLSFLLFLLYDDQTENSTNFKKPSKNMNQEEQDEGVTLLDILNNFVSAIFSNNNNNGTLIERIKGCFNENVPLVHQASNNTAHNVYNWTRKGSPLGALLVVSVGMIALLSLTGLLVFMLFFVAATVNAIVISLLTSLAAAGGFLALFFTCLTTIYIGALSVAVFVISTTTIIAIIAVIVATGWIGLFWTIWLATKKSASLAKHSLNATGSALSAYSSARHSQHNHDA